MFKKIQSSEINPKKIFKKMSGIPKEFQKHYKLKYLEISSRKIF